MFVIFILGGACFAIATSLYGAIASVQHPLLATVADGWLPEILATKNKSGYPWVMMLILYAFAIVPIWFDMGLNALISLMMIPTMVLNLINNALMVKLVKRYPDAWKSGFFKMPVWALYITITLAILADLLISVALMTQLKGGDLYFMIGMLLALFGYSFYRLKAGKVNLQDIQRIREEAESAAKNS